MTDANNRHVFIGGPSDGVTMRIVFEGKPKEVRVVRRDGVLYRFNGVVNEAGFREMVCDEREDSQCHDS